MSNDQLSPHTPVALYARVSSDRQDVDLSIAAQLRALRDHAEKNNYVVTAEYVDEAESGRIAERPQFRKMLDEATGPNAPFKEILVWKFSRFTRKREHAVAFKSMLRRKGIRVVSITEHADDSPTGKLMEAIIESVDEFYSENLAQEVMRGMREAAARGYYLAGRAPFGYNRVKVKDGNREHTTLEIDATTAAVVKEMFDLSLRGHGLKDICMELNGRGVTNRGKRWYKSSVRYVLGNEIYTGTAIWGRTSKGERKPEPVRAENAWPAIVSREVFQQVQNALETRAPSRQKPAVVGSTYLLSGLLRCGVCGRNYVGQAAKGGRHHYYICGTLYNHGAGTCSARYLNAGKLEDFVVTKIRERILNEETIRELVSLLAEEVDGMAGELSARIDSLDAELADVEDRLERLYEALESRLYTLESLQPRIMKLRARQDQLIAARNDAVSQLEQRRVEIPSLPEIAEYVRDFREFLEQGDFPERKALIRNFMQAIEVKGEEVAMTYTVPMPGDGVRKEPASVLGFDQSGPPNRQSQVISHRKGSHCGPGRGIPAFSSASIV